MSVRVEWTTAEFAGVSFLERGDLAPDGQKVDEGDYALLIGGSLCVQGSADELVDFANRVQRAVVVEVLSAKARS